MKTVGRERARASLRILRLHWQNEPVAVLT